MEKLILDIGAMYVDKFQNKLCATQCVHKCGFVRIACKPSFTSSKMYSQYIGARVSQNLSPFVQLELYIYSCNVFPFAADPV